MKAILDFNGYFQAGKRYTIKEYAMYVINDLTYDVVSHYFQVSKPPKSWKMLSLEGRKNYKVYFETFGIGWKTGTHDGSFIIANFMKTLQKVEAIYLINEAKRDLLENCFERKLPYNFIYLNKMGLDFARKMSTECRYHKEPRKNNCAKDNVLTILDWLKKKSLNHVTVPGEHNNIVIDFNGYFLAGTEFVIKEYSLYIFRDQFNKVVSQDFQVSKPPLPCHKLDIETQDSFTAYYDSYGIGWSKGTRDSNFIKSDLKGKLQNSKNIYVHDQTQKELLTSYLNHDFKAICLVDAGLMFEPQMTTDCGNHRHPDKNNCAHDNVLKMFQWLTTRTNNDFRFMSEDKNIVIDFNGFSISDEEYMIKEYALFIIRAGTNEIIHDEFVVSKPLYLCHKLDEIIKESYQAYYVSHGIEWSAGTRDSEFIRKDLQKKFRTAKNIYVRDESQSNLLTVFLLHDFKAISLGLETIKGTNCVNHQRPSENICALDNASKMLDLLTQKPPSSISRPREDVVLDFNGFFVDDKYIVKEYSWYVLDDSTYEVILNESDVSEPPMIQKDLDDQSVKNYHAFYRDIGINWDAGNLNFELVKLSLLTRLNVSNKVFVMDKTKHQLLQSYLDTELTVGFVYLENLGFKLQPTPVTRCRNHQDPSKNSCANDNVEKMLDWLSERKFGVRTRSEHAGIPFMKAVVVDFYGYDLPNNKYAIKELNAIVADKSSDESNLYLIVKPPHPDLQKLPDEVLLDYSEFRNQHNIEWNTGDHDFTQVRQTLVDYFKTATHIYVENLKKQNLLEKFIGKKHNFIRLEDLGFKEKPKLSTECPNHYDESSICAVDFSKTMFQWVEQNVLDRVSYDEVVGNIDSDSLVSRSAEDLNSEVNQARRRADSSNNMGQRWKSVGAL